MITQRKVTNVLSPGRGSMDDEQIKATMSTKGRIGVITKHILLINKLFPGDLDVMEEGSTLTVSVLHECPCNWLARLNEWRHQSRTSGLSDLCQEWMGG